MCRPFFSPKPALAPDKGAETIQEDNDAVLVQGLYIQVDKGSFPLVVDR